MKLGKIVVTVTLDRNPPIYFGSLDSVSGSVTLAFDPSQSVRKNSTPSELHGPLNVKVILEGYQITSCDEKGGFRFNNSRPNYSEQRRLFKRFQTLIDGAFKMSPGEAKTFLFTTSFPAHQEHDSIGGKEREPGADQPTNATAPSRTPQHQILPPSFQARLYDATRKYGEAVVQYLIRAETSMPGIDVQIEYVRPPRLRYELQQQDPALMNSSIDIERQLMVSGRDLVPPSSRPRGLRERTVSFLHDAPQYSFDVKCTLIPAHIWAWQHFAFDISVDTNAQQTPTIVHPDITLDRCRVTLLELTRIYDDTRTQYKQNTADIWTCLCCITPDDPSSKRNNHWKSITRRPLRRFPSTFASGRLSHSYKVRIHLEFSVGKQQVGCTDEVEITLHPELEYNETKAPAYFDDEPLPVYQQDTPERQ